jgi:Zn-dependent protease
MEIGSLADGLIRYLSLVILLTFHEYGHAWMASKCGDDTARDEGRCSLNPLVHIDPIGTVLIPLLRVLVPSASPLLIGWAKPVPVNPNRLHNPRLDDILISMAGPWMNVLLAVLFLGLARVAFMFEQADVWMFCHQTAILSLWLCVFNLLPIPPLDGSHVLRSLVGMSYDTYYSFAQYGFIAVLIVINIPLVGQVLEGITYWSYDTIATWFGMGWLV